MGKGTINSHLGDGRYTVTLDFNTTRLDSLISVLQAKITAIENNLPSLQSAETNAENSLNSVLSDLNSYIIADDTDAILAIQDDYIAALASYEAAVINRKEAELLKTSYEKKIEKMESAKSGEVAISAWCADLTTNLTGDVGLVEIPGERQSVQIYPGHQGRAVYDSDRDGQITPILGTTPAATFYNLAMFPGWQKWKPTYRHGSITALYSATDTCDITLDSAISTAQSLNVNQSSELTDVPIEYMSCNSGAFSVGDDVLVEFEGQDWASPKVIGFKEEPQMCDLRFYVHIKQDGYYGEIDFEEGDGAAFSEMASPDYLKINRIIIWEMGLDGSGAYDPGQGQVVLDVDIESETVYPATNSLTSAEELAFARQYITGIENEGLLPNDALDTWFKTGDDMSTPAYNYNYCISFDYVLDDTVTINAKDMGIDEKIPSDQTVDDGDYWHFIEPYPDRGTPLEQVDWLNQWCPDYGGNPTQVYDVNTWTDLNENSQYYPNTKTATNVRYRHLDDTGYWQECQSVTDGENQGCDCVALAQNCGEPDSATSVSVVGGKYFAPKSSMLFPCFFCYQTSRESNIGNTIYDKCEGAHPDCDFIGQYLNIEYSIGNSNSIGTGCSLVTPLEQLLYSEICIESGSIDTGSACDPSNCFSNYENFYMVTNGDGVRLCEVENLLPCTICPGGSFPTEWKKITTLIDNHVNYELSIPDPDNTDINYVSLFIHVDRSVGSQSAVRLAYGSTWVCKTTATSYGVDFENDVPMTFSNEMGVVIYIMSPEAFTWVEGGVTKYWDIHDHREDNPAEINSNRCLDLEDHINDILVNTIFANIEAHNDDLIMYDMTNDEGYYTLDGYGYEFGQGFVGALF